MATTEKATVRDEIWSAALELALATEYGFTVDEVLEAAGLDDAQRRTGRRVLHVMADRGWIAPLYPMRSHHRRWEASDRLDLDDDQGTIQVDEATTETLRELRRQGESVDDVVKRLISEWLVSHEAVRERTQERREAGDEPEAKV